MSEDKSGCSLEQAVGRIQQLMDPQSVVTYREKIPNRLGILREFDVVIRGQFAGHPMLGVVECKDWNHRVGTPEIDAFVTKTNVFEKELSTTHLSNEDIRPITLRAVLRPYVRVTSGSKTYRIREIKVRAERILEKKKRLMQMTGDALYDWATKSLKIAPTGKVSLHGFDPNMPDWEDHDGEIPETGPYQFIIHRFWGCIELESQQIPRIPRLHIECSRG